MNLSIVIFTNMFLLWYLFILSVGYITLFSWIFLIPRKLTKLKLHCSLVDFLIKSFSLSPSVDRSHFYPLYTCTVCIVCVLVLTVSNINFPEVSEMSSRLTSESRIYADKAKDLNRQVSFISLVNIHKMMIWQAICNWYVKAVVTNLKLWLLSCTNYCQ